MTRTKHGGRALWGSFAGGGDTGGAISGEVILSAPCFGFGTSLVGLSGMEGIALDFAAMSFVAGGALCGGAGR